MHGSEGGEGHFPFRPLSTYHNPVGDPAKEILKLIDEEKMDMVVMASHGQNGHFRFGSVAEKV